MIKAVIFDFFGVICSDEYWQFVKEKQHDGGKFTELSANLNLGRVSWDSFIGRVASETGKTAEDVNNLYTSERIHPELVAYISTLRPKYKTALLSNANRHQIGQILEKTRLHELFDEVIVSSDLGIAKPDPRIFDYTLKKLGVGASQAVFVDDISRYTDAADSLGIHAIHYQNFSQLKTEMDALLAKDAPSG